MEIFLTVYLHYFKLTFLEILNFIANFRAYKSYWKVILSTFIQLEWVTFHKSNTQYLTFRDVKKYIFLSVKDNLLQKPLVIAAPWTAIPSNDKRSNNVILWIGSMGHLIMVTVFIFPKIAPRELPTLCLPKLKPSISLYVCAKNLCCKIVLAMVV